jgi:NTE family protein
VRKTATRNQSPTSRHQQTQRGVSRSSCQAVVRAVPTRRGCSVSFSTNSPTSTSPLERLVRESIPSGDLRRNIDMREVDAVAIAATEISSGKSIVWVDNRERAVCRWAHDPFVVARPTALGPAHALASASIPFIFPAPKIDGRYFCDDGLRLNTPLAPALRLGADRLLIIGLRHPPAPEEEAALTPHRESNYSSPAYLAGKVLWTTMWTGS